ncbi:unnamed protein product, partial [Arabidopsis halleri]
SRLLRSSSSSISTLVLSASSIVSSPLLYYSSLSHICLTLSSKSLPENHHVSPFKIEIPKFAIVSDDNKFTQFSPLYSTIPPPPPQFPPSRHQKTALTSTATIVSRNI